MVVSENDEVGGGGSQAAPIAKRIIEKYWSLKKNKSVDEMLKEVKNKPVDISTISLNDHVHTDTENTPHEDQEEKVQDLSQPVKDGNGSEADEVNGVNSQTQKSENDLEKNNNQDQIKEDNLPNITLPANSQQGTNE